MGFKRTVGGRTGRPRGVRVNWRRIGWSLERRNREVKGDVLIDINTGPKANQIQK